MDNYFHFIGSKFKYGILLGVSLVLYKLFMWITDMETSDMFIGQYFNMLFVFISLSIILKAIIEENEIIKLNILQRIFISIYISLISYIIYNPFLFYYHKFINPNWLSYLLHFKVEEMQMTNLSNEDIKKVIKQIMDNYSNKNTIYNLSTFFPNVIVIPCLIGLLLQDSLIQKMKTFL